MSRRHQGTTATPYPIKKTTQLTKGNEMQTDELEFDNFDQMTCNFETTPSNNDSWLENALGKWMPENGVTILISCIGISLVINTLKGGGFTIGPNGLSLTPPPTPFQTL